MSSRIILFVIASFLSISGWLAAQAAPGPKRTLLPIGQMAEIIGEASGETAWNTIMETGGYNKDRLSDEYADTFYEARYIFDQLERHELPGAEIVRFPGRTVWDGVKGELWETSPLRQKLASYRDMTAMLAKGSNSADVEAELVWVGRGTKEELEKVDLAGKIVVTEGDIGSVHRAACLAGDAAGVVAISQSRSLFDPIQIPWRGLSGGRDDRPARFGFWLTARDGLSLKNRLLRGQKITVRAQVESKQEPYEYQVVVCHIPGTDPEADEIIFSAHLFEGITKQGANDNKSGSAAILEVARTLKTLIDEGRLPHPRRTIRFIWAPEYSGTMRWVNVNKEIMARTLCNINMDMVGEWLSRHQAFLCLKRTTFGNAHYINDVVEHYLRFVGEGSRERLGSHGSSSGLPRRIVAPTGADEPFYYSIEPHFGSSDHEVFNDWSVQVPGIMMIAWPDKWFHTSGDRVDKADPTQLKRVVVIGAAAAYTIAAADDSIAVGIAAETAGNGSRRLAEEFAAAIDDLDGATVETLPEAIHSVRVRLARTVDNEKATLDSILELAADRQTVLAHVEKLKQTFDAIGSAHLAAIDCHLAAVAGKLNTKPGVRTLTDVEQKASRIIPIHTAKVREGSYGAYRKLIAKIPKEEKDKRPYNRRTIASTSELHALIDGTRSVLDIKEALDAQYTGTTDLKGVLNYLEILELAGLVDFREE